MKAKVTWLPHRTFNNHQGAKKKAFPKQNIVFWQISLLKTVFPTLDTLWPEIELQGEFHKTPLVICVVYM